MKCFVLMILLFSGMTWAQGPKAETAQPAVSSPTAEIAASPESSVAKPGLWIVTEFNLQDFAWSDLNLDQEKTFSAPLIASWQKWLVENAQSISEIHTCPQECLNYYSAWQDRDPALLKEVPADIYRNGLWLKISFDVSVNKYQGKFKWSGRVVMLDINSKQILSSYEMLPEEKSWNGLSQKKVNSALATRIYRSALPALKFLRLAEAQGYTRASRLSIQGSRHLGDIMKVLEMLKTRGQSLGLLVQLDYVQQQEARILCFYSGEEKSFSDLLSQLKELKSSNSYELVHQSTGVDHVLKMVTR